ncbi:MAG TPA: DUF952 domain-containing protein [Afifellaceae bacterium]|jgi:uncharacterized protein (DUF952 family)|nr:DUF952 domain-containing protein [Afifellaceae bacterium]
MTSAPAKLIFKICPQELWRKAEESGLFNGAAIDLEDGFIHFSTADQVRETAARHFAGQEDLVLIAVDRDRLGADLTWEPSRGGDLFPHLYAAFSVEAVRWTKPLPLGADGLHQFPDLA